MSAPSADEFASTSLVRMAASGDQEAFTEIVEAHAADMARLSYAICGDTEMARDAVQSAWDIAWRKLGSLRDEHRLRGWLLVLAANEARRLGRRQRVRSMLERTTARGPAHGDDQPDPRVEKLDLALALRRLSSRDRQLLGLRYGVGLTSEEIGPQVGLSPSGVRVRLSRVLGQLRRELTDG